jgi:hypothetical protein
MVNVLKKQNAVCCLKPGAQHSSSLNALTLCEEAATIVAKVAHFQSLKPFSIADCSQCRAFKPHAQSSPAAAALLLAISVASSSRRQCP